MIDGAKRGGSNTDYIIVPLAQLILQTFNLGLDLLVLLDVIVWVVKHVLTLLDRPLFVDTGQARTGRLRLLLDYLWQTTHRDLGHLVSELT